MSASKPGKGDDESQNDNMEGWVDEMQKLLEDECVELMDEIRPMKLSPCQGQQ